MRYASQARFFPASTDSEDPRPFAQKLAQLCRDRGLSGVLDLGATGDSLASSLDRLGVRCVRAARSDDGGHLQVEPTRVAAQRRLEGRRYLTVCIDHLDRFDREDVPEAVAAVSEAAGDVLVIAATGRPDGTGGPPPCPLPAATWAEVFASAGWQRVAFEVLPVRLPGSVPQAYAHLDRVRPFGPVTILPAFWLVLQRKRDADPDLASRLRDMLDTGYRALKRRQFPQRPRRRLLLNLHHIQDASLLRPLLDIVPADDTAVLLANGDGLTPIEQNAIAAWCGRNGIEVHRYDRVDALPWADLKDGHLISATESSISVSHALSQRVVAAAQLHGCATTLLQSGIWATDAPSVGRVAVFLSRHILSWGEEYRRTLERRGNSLLGVTQPFGQVESNHFLRLGSPKFSDLLLPQNADPLVARLGLSGDRFRRRILVGLKSYQASGGADLSTRIIDFAADHPDLLFILRPHPRDVLPRPVRGLPENCHILDEVTSILLDLHLARVLPAVDVVVSGPSTLLLDGALAGKPVRCFDDGRSRPLGNLPCRPLTDVLADIAAAELPPAGDVEREFARMFADAADAQFFARFAEHVARVDQEPTDTSAATVASLMLTGLLERAASALRTQEDELGRLRLELAATNRKLAHQRGKRLVPRLRKIISPLVR